ncbi:hypothetical protein GFL85_34775 [Rhizobium laguerreae]|nr:hypothetical protein [Rhizobium laguerreae]NKM17479.1 hypothetical protein [Rhizobium laguerreae]NKM35160.1 hypothetical protein [Rhizobium laguerreae]NKM39913.1 hypothetical protein [Rhizobium laguerreae]NKM72207.1 hypothetical protein [Rhizobium laguerreae]
MFGQKDRTGGPNPGAVRHPFLPVRSVLSRLPRFGGAPFLICGASKAQPAGSAEKQTSPRV